VRPSTPANGDPTVGDVLNRVVGNRGVGSVADDDGTSALILHGEAVEIVVGHGDAGCLVSSHRIRFVDIADRDAIPRNVGKDRAGYRSALRTIIQIQTGGTQMHEAVIQERDVVIVREIEVARSLCPRAVRTGAVTGKFAQPLSVAGVDPGERVIGLNLSETLGLTGPHPGRVGELDVGKLNVLNGCSGRTGGIYERLKE